MAKHISIAIKRWNNRLDGVWLDELPDNTQAIGYWLCREVNTRTGIPAVFVVMVYLLDTYYADVWDGPRQTQTLVDFRATHPRAKFALVNAPLP